MEPSSEDGNFKVVYLILSGEQKGPFEVDQLRTMWGSGMITTQTQCWREGFATWQPFAVLASSIGIRVTVPPPLPNPPPPAINFGCFEIDGELTIRRLGDYERISGILWIVLGAFQILTIIGIIAGIWNIFAGISRMKVSKRIKARENAVPGIFEDYTQLVVIGIINLLVGGVVGVVFVAFDFYIRDVVLKNARLFTAEPIQQPAL